MPGPVDEKPSCGKVTRAALAFERLTRWVAGATASKTSAAPELPAAGVAASEDEADPRFTGAAAAASWDVDSLTLDGVEADDRDTAPFPDDDAPVLFPDAEASAEELDAVEEPVSDGSADAAHGVVASADPMPRVTANAPTRPIQLAYHIS